MSLNIDSLANLSSSATASLQRRSDTATASAGAAPSAVSGSNGDTVKLTGVALGLQNLDSAIARTPAVDVKRVDALRNAIANGNYQIDPHAIAAKLLGSEQLLG